MTITQLPIDVAQPDAPITDLAPAVRAVVAMQSSKTEFDMRAMVAKHTGLVEIKDKAGREQVHSAAMELMRARTTIKKVADEARDDAKKFNAAVISEEKRLTAIVEGEETRLKALRDAWDAEQERIKREAEEKERARVLSLGARIQEIRSFARLANDCRTSDTVRRLVDRLAGLDMTGFEEFEAEAIAVLTETRQQVENTLNVRLATEAEAARIKTEREELARQQAEAKRQAEELATAQKAEADKLAAERAELDRMRAEIEAAKAPAVTKPMSDREWAALPAGDRELPHHVVYGSVPAVRGVDLVDTVSMPVTTHTSSIEANDTPPATGLIQAIATAYGVDNETACHWLCVRADDFLEWTEPESATA